MKLREKMQAKAEQMVNVAVGEAERNLKIIADKHNMKVADLAKFVAGGKTKTLEAKVVRQITKRMEDDLIAKFNDQMDIDDVEERKEAPDKEGKAA